MVYIKVKGFSIKRWRYIQRFLLLWALLLGCSNSGPEQTQVCSGKLCDIRSDAGRDVVTLNDAGSDTENDAGSDADTETETDAATDAGSDADVETDAATDAGQELPNTLFIGGWRIEQTEILEMGCVRAGTEAENMLTFHLAIDAEYNAANRLVNPDDNQPFGNARLYAFVEFDGAELVTRLTDANDSSSTIEIRIALIDADTVAGTRTVSCNGNPFVTSLEGVRQ